MGRLRRRGRVLKWTGLAFALLVAAAWSVSVLGTTSYRRVAGPPRSVSRSNQYYYGREFTLRQGGLISGHGIVLSVGHEDLAGLRVGAMLWPGWSDLTWSWKPYFAVHSPPFGWTAIMPLGTTFLVIGSVTVWLWWRDRRYPRHCCQLCGYNLTGNVSGVCPECGVACAGDDARRVVTRQWGEHAAAALVGLALAWAVWDTVEEMRKAKPLRYYGESPSRIVVVVALTSAVVAMVVAADYIRRRWLGRKNGGR